MRSSLPKVLHPLCGRPLIAWPIQASREAGAGKVVVVDGPERRLADHLPEDVTVAVQAEPKGTGDAVAAAAGEIAEGDTVVVLVGDVPLVDAETLTGLVEAHEASGAAATMLTAELEDPTGYGRVVRDAEGQVERVVETKAGGRRDRGRAGDPRGQHRHPRVRRRRARRRRSTQLEAANSQGELFLPDVLPRMKEAGREIGAHVAADAAVTLGINDRADLARVRAIAQERINLAHMRAGVTLVDPASAHIDVTVEIGPDTVIEPSCVLRGATTIGEGATIGAFCTLIDSEIGDGATVLRAHLDRARVHARAIVGPFAYLRPDAVLHEGAKAGTFVEIKNSNIGAGSKVPHLSYIGDTDIGERANIGAATITANYDGRKKHRTTIGDRVRTSVDTSLVAPVSLGDDAYTGAGSVITDDIPPGALGIARERQRNIEGYADRVSRRER